MIENGKVVSLSYQLKNAQGEEIDSANSADPFTYLHGASQIIPGLENALKGLKVGDVKDVQIAAADAYGEVVQELKITVNRSSFPPNADLKPGAQFTANVQGQSLPFRVESVNGDQIVIDGNHPLAGEDLSFHVEVLGVRDATETEKEHGHAHGEGGHEH
jgi:FKBP-type peptidyl-prolyl cis-trans isomerase SlyD